MGEPGEGDHGGVDQSSGEGSGGATEPITLTDPDGAVTRVAPWSSWTREQVRAPGGEPALVTRLDQGQLWFAAGRRRSPWHHEVHVGPAVVSTPRGRFQATAEPDGGATIVCLSGRARVVAGLREPVLLGPEQSAAVSADGRTLVVMDRAAQAPAEDPLAGVDDADAPAPEGEAADGGETVAVAAAGPGNAEGGEASMEASDTSGQASPAHSPRPKTTRKASTTRRRRRADRERRWGWVPEAVAVAALVALLVAAVVVFGQPSDDDETASPTQVTVTGTQGGSTTLDITTSTAPSTTTEPEPETTTSTAPPTTTRPPTISAGATAIGELVGCRRAEGGVKASVRVSHRQGPTSRFQVTVRLLDAAGGEFASATGPSPELAPGGTAVTDVLIEVEGRAAGSCEVVSVSPG